MDQPKGGSKRKRIDVLGREVDRGRPQEPLRDRRQDSVKGTAVSAINAALHLTTTVHGKHLEIIGAAGLTVPELSPVTRTELSMEHKLYTTTARLLMEIYRYNVLAAMLRRAAPARYVCR